MLFSWLASALALGGLVALLSVEPADFGRGFHRFTGALASLLLAAGLAGGALAGATGWLAVLSCAGWVMLTHWGPLAWIRPALGIPVATALAALLAGPDFPPRRPLLILEPWARPGNALGASLLLGSVCLALLLGHWYLVIHGLPLRHLRRMTILLGACLAFRVLLGAAALFRADPVASLEMSSAWRVAGGAAGFFFWQRVGIGLLAPGILTVLVDRTVRIGSTQSATGLLYVTVIFILIGEMISRYLYLTLGIPG